MAKFRQVYTEFWNDPNVVEEMTPEDKYFMLYLLTNDKTTQIGVYQITKKQIAFDMGYSPESVESLIERFSKKHDRIIYNKDTREVAIKNWGKYNFFRGGKPFMDLIKSEVEKVKDPRLVKYVFDNYIKSHEINKEVVALIADYLERKNVDNESYHDTLTSRTTIRGQEEEKEEEKEKEYKEIKHHVAKAPRYDADNKYYQIALYLRSKILAVNEKQKVPKEDPKSMDKWSDAIRKIIELDKRTMDELKEITEFVFKSDFWDTVIQSPAGLRKHWDKIWGQLLRDRKGPKNSNDYDSFSKMADEWAGGEYDGQEEVY